MDPHQYVSEQEITDAFQRLRKKYRKIEMDVSRDLIREVINRTKELFDSDRSIKFCDARNKAIAELVPSLEKHSLYRSLAGSIFGARKGKGKKKNSNDAFFEREKLRRQEKEFEQIKEETNYEICHY